MDYRPPALLSNAHLATIYPSLFRKVDLLPYTRERITTADGDFLDLDWLSQQSDKAVIISHGLEGNSGRPYVRGMARAFYQAGWDVVAWNFRGCSGEMNKTIRFYHSGATDDLAFLTQHVVAKGYQQVFLIGFSLGGNLTIKFLGEMNAKIPSAVKAAVTFSTPFDLHSGCVKLEQSSNWIYTQRFLRSLKEKVIRKASIMGGIDIQGINKIKTLKEFDDRYTAPIHGFKNAMDYYQKCSSLNFIRGVVIPTLAVNSRNDPFLGQSCFPAASEIQNPHLRLEYPLQGGHVGFALFNQKHLYWSELRALEFIQSIV